MSNKTIVKVTWLDATHAEDEIEEKDIHGLQPLRMVSFGLLMVDDEDRVIISSHVGTTVSKDGDTQIDFRDTLVIPRKTVLSIDVRGQLEVG